MAALLILLVCWRISAAGAYYLQRYAPPKLGPTDPSV